MLIPVYTLIFFTFDAVKKEMKCKMSSPDY